MTDTTTSSLTLEHVRAVRRRIHAHLADEMCDLGADPAVLAQEAVEMSGLEFFERWFRPEIPPPPALVVLLGMEWVELEPGRAVIALEPEQWMLNPLGSIHGGITATLLDTAMSAAVHTTLPAGTGYATTDLHVRYLRPMSAGMGRVVATGTAVHSGRRQATAEGRLEAEATGKLIAASTAGCAIIRAS